MELLGCGRGHYDRFDLGGAEFVFRDLAERLKLRVVNILAAALAYLNGLKIWPGGVMLLPQTFNSIPRAAW